MHPLTICRIISTLDVKSRNLLEKDPSNPNGAHKAAASPAKAGGSGAGRSALREAIAARKKALPSRPESAQPALDMADPAPKSSTRSVPTGAPLSSLSSAPMRPAMKPRRAEISRPATADPYAQRPSSRAAQTSGKPVGSPRSLKSKASTPSSKPINAPRLRPHESGQSGTTRGKPKKLDLSKSKSHGDLHAASRAPSDSDDSVAHHLHIQAHHADVAEDHEDSPAPVVLESPPLHASQPQLHDEQAGIRDSATPEAVGEPQPMSLEEPVAAASPSRGREPKAATPVRHPDFTPEPEPVASTQPEEMVIYEDPATPVAAEADTSTAALAHLTPTKSPQRVQDHATSEAPVVDAAPVLQTPAENSALDLAPSQGDATGGPEVPFPSSTRRTPLRASPSPSRRAPATPSDNTPGVESGLPYESTTGRTPNNENATAQIRKVATPRSVTKPGALEEVPLNESISRNVEMRRSAESLSQSTPSDEPFRRSRKWAERHRSPSPRSKDPANAREMLHKALSRIASKTMDISGYRKLQGLFQYHGEEIVSREQDYYAMLEALLIELESAPANRKDHDVKTQILATVRSMLLRTSDLFHRYDVPAMAAIIRARRHYESSSHFVTCLEEVAEQLASLIAPQIVIDGVLQGLDIGEDTQGEGASRSIIMGLATLHQALSPAPVEISDDVLASVGGVVSKQLSHPRPGVRKQATELCTLLNLKFGLDRVQKVTPSAGEGSLNLLTYFMARRSQ